jgi:hypothetical protein
MAIRSLRAGRQNYPPETYLGTKGELFYVEATGEFRVCDAVTPGGTPIPLVLASQTVAGAIKIGPGINLNSQGQIIIDSSGLDFNFGDFEARVGTYSEGHPKEDDDYAILSSINADEDIVIASNGEGSIKAIGEFEIYAPNGDVNSVLLAEPFFKVQKDGQVKIRVPSVDPLEGAVEIIGTDSGEAVVPAVAGVMLHITGNNDEFATVYNDGVNNFSNYIGRRYNGTAAAPTQVLSGNVLCRFSGTGYGATTFPAGAAASVSMVALENFTNTQQGAKIDFLTAPIGGLTRQLVASVSVADGVVATKFAGPLTGNVTGNADTATTATNLAAATGILAGAITIDPASVAGQTSSTQTFTLTGLTTNHKIVITAGTAFNSGLIIQAAFASALNTVSIEFRNTTNPPINANATVIQYFAWV